jgi:hypothetical protein
MLAIAARVCNAKPGTITLEMHHDEYDNSEIALAAGSGNGSIRGSEYHRPVDRTRRDRS